MRNLGWCVILRKEKARETYFGETNLNLAGLGLSYLFLCVCAVTRQSVPWLLRGAVDCLTATPNHIRLSSLTCPPKSAPLPKGLLTHGRQAISVPLPMSTLSETGVSARCTRFEPWTLQSLNDKMKVERSGEVSLPEAAIQ